MDNKGRAVPYGTGCEVFFFPLALPPRTPRTNLSQVALEERSGWILVWPLTCRGYVRCFSKPAARRRRKPGAQREATLSGTHGTACRACRKTVQGQSRADVLGHDGGPPRGASLPSSQAAPGSKSRGGGRLRLQGALPPPPASTRCPPLGCPAALLLGVPSAACLAPSGPGGGGEGLLVTCSFSLSGCGCCSESWAVSPPAGAAPAGRAEGSPPTVRTLCALPCGWPERSSTSGDVGSSGKRAVHE